MTGLSADVYQPAAIERKWQDRWRDLGTNHTDVDAGADPFYALMMFPYPSAEGLHVGNLFAFTGNDIYARYQRLKGHTVFEPLGYDAFGIHSENYALRIGVHPTVLIPRNIANFRRQLDRTGLMVDWRYQVDTTDPRYYKWTQWIFLQLYKAGLAYKSQGAVNWCPADKTVLANEQVIDGHCERCGTAVEQRYLDQWFFAISRMSERLLRNLDWLDWSESTKTAQRNWIGKSSGAELTFDSPESPGITVFTTRPDTIFGATYLVLAPEHPLARTLATPEHRAAVDSYLARAAQQDVVSRKITKDKTGVFTGAFAINPATRAQIPIWVADYVLMEYGTGAIMGVPSDDERDNEFAVAHGLPIVQVVHDERLVNSGQFNGLSVEDAKGRIIDWLAEKGAAKRVENYRLHDWTISRQRYWGPPIPIIYCADCGIVPVPERDLPVVLPYIQDFRPDDSGTSPLARHEEWYRVACPKCGGEARRETDVSDNFLDNSWYFLRYPSTDRDDVPFDPTLTKKWLPVKSYIGGNEHAVLHLMYSRFITMVLHDLGHLSFEEPFVRFRAHGLIVKDGAKMSKTKGNIINPDEYINAWGADTFRMYLMFLGDYLQGGDFRDASISGVNRYLNRLWSSVADHKTDGEPDPAVMSALHRTIKKVGDDIPKLGYNTAIAALMEYMNTLREGERHPHRAEVEPLVQLTSPFAPHIAEELWERLGHTGSVFDAGWPKYDPALIASETVTYAVQVNGKLRGTIDLAPDVSQDAAVAAALADPQIRRHVPTEPRRVIFVAGKLLNFVL
ncbi:MAG TPA: leucine--tRNA ligase [Gemmatimonadaceae bacterium]|nr:leucine--tRNA ligase [Gemmatimonadaceae bacterium]